jgi:hypothetical protein
MKTLKNEQKPSSNYPSSSFSIKKFAYYFHPDDDFREDHTWGEKSKLGSNPHLSKLASHQSEISHLS